MTNAARVDGRPLWSWTLPKGTLRVRATIDGPEKFCGFCSEWWPTECFNRDKRTPDGLFNKCKACYEQMRSVRGYRR